MGLDWHHVMWESRKAHAEELLGVPAEYMYRSLCMSRNDTVYTDTIMRSEAEE